MYKIISSRSRSRWKLYQQVTNNKMNKQNNANELLLFICNIEDELHSLY